MNGYRDGVCGVLLGQRLRQAVHPAPMEFCSQAGLLSLSWDIRPVGTRYRGVDGTSS